MKRAFFVLTALLALLGQWPQVGSAASAEESPYATMEEPLFVDSAELFCRGS